MTEDEVRRIAKEEAKSETGGCFVWIVVSLIIFFGGGSCFAPAQMEKLACRVLSPWVDNGTIEGSPNCK